MKTSDDFSVSNKQMVWIAKKNPNSGRYSFIQVMASDADKKGVDFYRVKENCEKETKRLREL